MCNYHPLLIDPLKLSSGNFSVFQTQKAVLNLKCKLNMPKSYNLRQKIKKDFQFTENCEKFND